MTDLTTDGAGASRRRFLGGLAAAGAALATSGGLAGARRIEGGAVPEIVADFEPPSLPENLGADEEGNVYLSMAPTGELRRIAPDGSASTVARIDVGEDGSLLGNVVADDGTIYAVAATGDPETHGVYEISPGGEVERLTPLSPDETMPNGILLDPYRSGAVLVTDHLGGAVWRVTDDGEAERWVADPLLDPNPYADLQVGVDGIDVHPDGDVFVDNLSFGSVVRVPVESGGVAGTPEVYVQDDALVGADGMRFAEDGTLFVAVNGQDKVSRVTPDREIETVVEGDGLDGPADVHFGRAEEDQTSLYVCNSAFGSVAAEGETPNPSLMRLDVGVRGFFPEEADLQPAGGNVTDGAATDGNVTEGNATGGNVTVGTDGENATTGNATTGNSTVDH